MDKTINYLKDYISNNNYGFNNQILIIGGKGEGKTYLSQLFYTFLLQKSKKHRPFFTYAIEFRNSYIKSIRNNNQTDFFQNIITHNAFIIDDIDHLHNKEKTQEFLFEVLDDFSRKNKPIIITSSNKVTKTLKDDLFIQIHSGIIVSLDTINSNKILNYINQQTKKQGFSIDKNLIDMIINKPMFRNLKLLNGLLATIKFHQATNKDNFNLYDLQKMINLFSLESNSPNKKNYFQLYKPNDTL